ncbi:hypothetical protein EX895_004585 [Sporisorium graminicola]|uniref:Uncharacterized protein n=1 Tax=Sporisorium graminicola TaxID=280036 RepID=A0A4U7KR15_9BASI|nr:hypothetical protein EX895_004585 [Sporisorium graminicola]TKY86436.1 hypothetical protein EX895_004585 [Sporisorium graminicola]
MLESVNRGQNASGKGAGPSDGLSLRERMRLQAQQKLQNQAASSSSPSSTNSIVDIDVDEDEDDLGSLTLGRTKRLAALKRPASYSIDPLDDTSRLKCHPNKLPTLTGSYATVPVNKAKGIDGLLREQQRRSKRGTDAHGFSRAEAIARSMEEERLGRMGIAYMDESDDDDGRSLTLDPCRSRAFSSRNTVGKNGKEQQQLTVKALSPTIPSFLWSSQSEAADSEDEARNEVDSRTAEDRLAASLDAVGADEDDKQLALDILQRDVGEASKGQAQKLKGRITFYKAGKVLAPATTFFCPFPTISRSTKDTRQLPAAAGASTAAAADKPTASDEIQWNTLARHILLAGLLPPSLDLDKRHIRRILVWLSISFILEHDAVQSGLICMLFQSLVFESAKSHYHRQLDSAIPKALTDVVNRVPRILHRLGMDDEVFEQCFPDNSEVADVPLFTVAQRKPTASSSQAQAQQDGARSSSPSAEFTEFKAYLTQAERDEILINLAGMLDKIASRPHPTLITDNLTIVAGYVASMAIACAAATSLCLVERIGAAFNSIFSAATREGSETLRTLQEQVCRRTFSALGTDAVAVRARLVTTLPGEGREIGAVRRWLAWRALTEHIAQAHASLAASPLMSGSDIVPSSDPFADEGEEMQQQQQQQQQQRGKEEETFEPLTLDLDMLVAAVDAGDARSPFYVAPFTVYGGEEMGPAAAAVTAKKDDDDEKSPPPDAPPTAGPVQHTTDFEAIIAATQLVSHALRDLPIHMCTFHPCSSSSSAADRSTPTPARPNGTPSAQTSTSGPRPRAALRLALAPYLSLDPELDDTRTDALHTLVQRLAHVNSRIWDNRGNVILQTLAKDALHRTGLALEYQLDMYGASGSRAGFIQ